MTKSAAQKREWPIILIAFLFMFFFGRILGPFSVVTQVGSNVLGVFIGVILLTVFTSQSTLAAILGIIAMVYSGFLTSSAAVSSWMGGSTVCAVRGAQGSRCHRCAGAQAAQHQGASRPSGRIAVLAVLLQLYRFHVHRVYPHRAAVLRYL